LSLGSQIYEDGGWICEKMERGAGVFLGKEKMMKVEGKENCRVLFHLIFLMKCHIFDGFLIFFYFLYTVRIPIKNHCWNNSIVIFIRYKFFVAIYVKKKILIR